MAYKKSGVQGVSRLRKSLRRIPEAVREELTAELERSGAELESAIKANAPVKEGFLRDAAFHQMSRDGLAVHVGYSKNRTGFKRKWKKGGFKALWQEFGTRTQPRTPFISPAFRALLPTVLARIDGAVNRVLRRARDFGKGG